ncbi:MAG: universal stress protein [Dehalococcoidia bacterium]|jgi:nucleotide-binding universal stress UspA family protein
MLGKPITKRKKTKQDKSLDERIVVPLDGSKLAEIALPYAEEIAVRTGRDIVMLSVIEFADPASRSYLTKTADNTRSNTSRFAGESNAKGIKVFITTREGNPAESIVDFTTKWGHNLIVMATHGRSGIGRWAIGSVADKVVRAVTNSSVFLVRGNKAGPEVRDNQLLKKVLVPLDGSVPSQSIIPFIKKLAKKLSLELMFFHVESEEDRQEIDARTYLEERCGELEKHGIAAGCEVRTGSPADSIIDLADELGVDFIAMSTRGKSNITPWSIGSVAQKVLLGGNTPLMLVRQGN